MNDHLKEIGTLISSEWHKVASALRAASEDEYQELLNLDVVYRANMTTEVIENIESIIKLLVDLGNSFEKFYKNEEWVCILDMYRITRCYTPTDKSYAAFPSLYNFCLPMSLVAIR